LRITTHFFTGFPGFLGSELLPRILARDPLAEAACLVQPKYEPLARDRLTQLRLAEPRVAERVRLLTGDITLPDLGLGSDYDGTAARITSIWHLAAIYDLATPLAPAMRVNVDGTRHVLDLARHSAGLERLHYVSTCYVSGRYPGAFGEEDLEKGQSFNNHYERTKYFAEVAVRDAMGRGLPATIYRPSIVVGSSRTGETQKFDGPYYIIRWILRQPGRALVPVLGDPTATRVNLVPSDFVTAAILHLSALPHSRGRTYHLADSDPLTVAELLTVLSEATGKRIRTVRAPAAAARWALDHLPGLERITGIPAESIDYFVHPTHYTVFQARADLEGSGLEVPPFGTYAKRLVDYMRGHPDAGVGAMS
jgi:thioester reductase-like protein